MTKSMFTPPQWLANRHIQTVLASMPPRKNLVKGAATEFCAQSRELIVDCGAGVRLLAHYTPPVAAANGQLAVLIHGWEGSADSTYILSLGPLLAEHGFGVIRLNLRDHGDSHHLNEGVFHSCRLAEVVGAIASLQADFPAAPMSIIGYSLGGNFALRVGAGAREAGIRLEKIVAVCPVLNPAETMRALDSGWQAYKHYFITKWHRSLVRKSMAFPDLYSFDRLARFPTLEQMTDFLVSGYTEYPDLHSYLNGYALTGDRLRHLDVASTMLLAADDPVIPVKGLDAISISDSLQICQTERGGHVGYLESLGPRGWLDTYILSRLQSSS